MSQVRKQILIKFHLQNLDSAQRVGIFNIGSGRVLDKIPGSGSGSGRVGVSKIQSGISRYLFYSRVFLGIWGISGNFWVFLGLPIYLNFFCLTFSEGSKDCNKKTGLDRSMS